MKNVYGPGIHEQTQQTQENTGGYRYRSVKRGAAPAATARRRYHRRRIEAGRTRGRQWRQCCCSGSADAGGANGSRRATCARLCVCRHERLWGRYPTDDHRGIGHDRRGHQTATACTTAITAVAVAPLRVVVRVVRVVRVRG